MICASCRHANRDGARFCDQCGQRLDAKPVAVPPGAAVAAPDLSGRLAGYTPRHLAEKILTSRAAIEGERKTVTVLFADCVGFTDLSTRLDPEALHDVMDGWFQRVLDAVHRYEGTVNQFTGDGVMALFGAPVAHEDHALRAAAAALAIRDATRAYGDSLRRERGLVFAMRLGLNTGQVVVGRIGDDLRMDYTAQGETVNLAARLQAVAQPGSVLASALTRELVAGHFDTEPAGPFALKGFAAPVPAFVVCSRRRRARFQVTVERGLSPLAGRERELACLTEAFDRARAGQAQAVSLVGDAGSGKSRLAWELRGAVEAGGAACLYAQCAPHADALPYAVVGQLLRASLGIEDGESEPVQLAKVDAGARALDAAEAWALPYLKHLLALPAPELDADGLDPAQRRNRLTEAVRAFALAGPARRAVLITVEDLQWIDRQSEELIAAIVQALPGRCVMVLATHRPGHAPAWQGSALHRRLEVGPLAPAQTLALAGALLADWPHAGAAAEAVALRAGGNPLFVEELVRYLRTRPAAAVLRLDEVPATIEGLLTARIDRLPEGVKRTLQLASVLGAEFALPVLEDIAPPDGGARAAVAELVRLQLLREQEAGHRYAFAHLLVRQVAYDELLRKARAELHARAAAALERRYAGRTDEVLRDLAEHFAGSGQRDRALHYLVRAGDRAAGLYAYAEAAGYYRRALDLAEPLPQGGAVRAEILDRLGEAAFAHGELDAAREHWRACLVLLEPDGERRRVADLHRRIACAAWAAGDRDGALRHLESGRAALGTDADSLEAARLDQEQARIHLRLGEAGRALEFAARARALGERLDAPDVVADALNAAGVALARSGDLDRGAELVERSLEIALDRGLGSVACRAYSNLAAMVGPLDRERAQSCAHDGLALAQRIGDRLQQSWLHCALASGHCGIGDDYDAGVRAAQAAIDLDRALGHKGHLPVPLIVLAQVHQCRGDAVASERSYREALGLSEAIGEPQLLVPCYDGLATLAMERGDDDEAEAWLARCRALQQATGWSDASFLVLPFLY